MYRLGHLKDGQWPAHSHPAIFESTDRIVAGVPGGDPAIFERLIECMEPPYYLLYVLHTSRGEAEPGRYQTPALQHSDVKAFLTRFGAFLSADARYDLWAHSPTSQATVVWDRHNQLFAYGPLAQFSTTLQAMGFTRGKTVVPTPHAHHYCPELDPLAKELLTIFDWSFSPLRSEDAQ
ncbi:hypothetical protein XBLMG947_1178 [Xanthomonas bromi]|uniref:Uncharacterized protein n=1 Tax=Xanthomonas bromi TaxID=56449 RepID=A0A1C3NJ11_9XANT|nr:hypothetical protein [Xanthomonas bromi]SBV50400.1 hypothetical protein XBLMG947_1178 [Xanthomonas bromi]